MEDFLIFAEHPGVLARLGILPGKKDERLLLQEQTLLCCELLIKTFPLNKIINFILSTWFFVIILDNGLVVG